MTRVLAIIVLLLVVGSLHAASAQDIPTSTDTATWTPTETPTETPSPTATETPLEPTLASETPTAALEQTVEPTAEVTAESTPEVTEESTPEVTPSETPTQEWVILAGVVAYQNRLPDNAGIRIRIYSSTDALLDTTISDGAGGYTISVPAGELFWLVVDAPLHRQVRMDILAGDTLPFVQLPGGDLDGDGCIGALDLALLSENFSVPDTPASDITNDGVTDAADIAILSGNLQEACPPPR